MTTEKVNFPDDESRHPWLTLLLEAYRMTDPALPKVFVMSSKGAARPMPRVVPPASRMQRRSADAPQIVGANTKIAAKTDYFFIFLVN